MLIRRIFEHLKTQNWVAIGLDFIVVVVGIFLAFQLERWYSERRMRADAQERLAALSEDVSRNRIELNRSIEIRNSVVNSAEQLLILDEQQPTYEQYDLFYQLLANTSRTFTPRLRRGAYDVLIATGEIDLIEDESLKTELADFYAGLDEFLIYNQGIWMVDRNTFEPFVIRNLDHVAMLQFVHPDVPEEKYGIQQTSPTQNNDTFLEVIGTSEFEGVIGAKWHATRDEIFRLERLRDRLSEIEAKLVESIPN